MIIAKIINKNQIESTFINDNDDSSFWAKMGYKPLIESEPIKEYGQFETIDYEYIEMKDSIRQIAVVVPDYAAEIAWHRSCLDAMDWKANRNTIAEKVGKPIPISWETIYTESQIHRDRINELEELEINQ